MTALTRDITALFTAALANPQCDTTRGALMDAMQERDCWTRETILPWVIQYRSNDAPRLLYALWCEGNGEGERGEFIRVQCEMERLNSAVNTEKSLGGGLRALAKRNKRWGELHIRERELRTKYARAWYSFGKLQACAVWDHSPLIRWSADGENDALAGDDSRGFISHITCTAADWLTHADAITREHPVERVRFSGLGHDPFAFLFENQFTAAGLNRAFAISPKWPGIEFEVPSSGMPVPHAFTPTALFPAAS